jgi:hypothetical protein
MKNKTLGTACIMIIAVLGTFNINLSNSAKNDTDFNIKMNLSEANAQNYNSIGEMWSQGLTADEKEKDNPCPEEKTETTEGHATVGAKGVTVGGGGSTTTTTTSGSGATWTSCPIGTANCTETDCK